MELSLGQLEKRLRVLGRERDRFLRYVRELRLKTAREFTIIRWEHSADLVCADYTYLENFLRNAKLEFSRHDATVTVSGA